MGLSEQAARQLASAGVAAIDVAGAGRHLLVASRNAPRPHRHPEARGGRLFGLGHSHRRRHPNVRRAAPHLPVIAFRRSARWHRRRQVPGARRAAGGFVRPIPKAAAVSLDAAGEAIAEIGRELHIASSPPAPAAWLSSSHPPCCATTPPMSLEAPRPAPRALEASCGVQIGSSDRAPFRVPFAPRPGRPGEAPR